MSDRKGGGRFSVKSSAREPFSQLCAVLVGDHGDGFVSQPRTGFDKPPAQVDVLARLQRLVETADLGQRRAPADDRGAWHVGDGAVRHDGRLALAEVQRRAHRLVAGHQAVGLRQVHYPRCDQSHCGITEVAEERFKPATSRHHIGVEKRDEVGGAYGQAGVTRCGGPLAAGMAQHLQVAMCAVEVRVLDRRRRAVIHHHHSHATQRRNQPVDTRLVVAHWNNNSDVTVGRSASRPRMGHGGIEQCAGDLRAQRVVHLESAAVEHGLRGGRQSQQPGGRTAEQGRPLPEHLDPAINLNGEPVG